MSMRNTDNEDHLHFRSERINCQNGLFYFSTREGTLEGPFTSRDQAEIAAALFIRYHLDPTKIESAKHKPDAHIRRYGDRREQDRRGEDRRTGDRRGEDSER